MTLRSPRWKLALDSALEKDKDGTVIQFATIDSVSLAPQVRSLIFRRFVTPSKKISLPLVVATTDARTPKVKQIINHPRVQAAWWIHGAQQQFRIGGMSCIVPFKQHPLYPHFSETIGAAPSNSSLGALREENFDWETLADDVFKSLSPFMRAIWCRPPPGDPYKGGDEDWPTRVDEPKDGDSDEVRKVWELAKSNFALLVIDPDDVDFVDMSVKPNKRWKLLRTPEGDWEEEPIIP